LLEEDALPVSVTALGYTTAELANIRDSMFEAHEMALACADIYRPQMRVLFAMLIKMALR
jgi:hypothetical protein